MALAPKKKPVQTTAPPRSELGKLQLKSRKTADESLESTRRMVALCEESKEAGIRTLVSLDEQGEQLDHIEGGMIQINEDMREAELNLAGLGKCCGLTCSCPLIKNFKEKSASWKLNSTRDDGKIVSSQPKKVMENMAFGGFIAKVTNDGREVEMENNMTQVSSMLGNLRDMAIDIGGEIETQNRQLNNINAEADSNAVRIRSANALAGKILQT